MFYAFFKDIGERYGVVVAVERYQIVVVEIDNCRAEIPALVRKNVFRLVPHPDADIRGQVGIKFHVGRRVFVLQGIIYPHFVSLVLHNGHPAAERD